MRRLFITATGTDIGKTIISAAIAEGLTQLNKAFRYWKPVQCGIEQQDKDTIKKIVPKSDIVCNAFTFSTPASPDQASRIEKVPHPTVKTLLENVQQMDENILLIEGAGGLIVPLNDHNETWLDFLSHSMIPLEPILVAESGLGTLNHTAMSIKCMYARGVKPQCIILNGPDHPENLKSLRRMFPELKNKFFCFPYIDKLESNPNWAEHALELAKFTLKENTSIEDPRDDDNSFVWHPFTQHATAPQPVALQKAKGSWLQTIEGKTLFDATSSWWVNTIGHGRIEIAEAIAQQQQTLDHTVFGGTCHSPSAQLSKKITSLTGNHLKRVFFTDNGSCAVEVALKMAIQSFYNRGIERHKFVCLKGGYHGDTFGAMSVGLSSGFYEPFQKHLFENFWLTPTTEHPSWICPKGPAAQEENIAEMEELFEKNHDSIAGVLIEPWLQGASGMIIQHLPWLQRLGELTNSYKIPLILDEVFTGMGRTGSFFAFQRAGLKPDIICTSKGLTGGNLPLALTIASEEIFEHFLSNDAAKTFFHGHSFTANPIACSAALAALEIYEKEQLVNKSFEMEKKFKSWIEAEGHELGLVNPRALGGMLAFEVPDSEFGNYFSSKNQQITNVSRQLGILIRPLGNTIYLVPPLTTSDSDLDWALDRMKRIILSISSEN